MPHPYGNRIDLAWENPEADNYPWVRIVRREGTSPLSLDDGRIVADISTLLFSTNSIAVNGLDENRISFEIEQMFLDFGISLSEDAAAETDAASTKWTITDREKKYIIKQNSGTFCVYRSSNSATDVNLKSETIYYYALFPFKNNPLINPLDYVIDSANRTAAMASGPYDMAGQMYDLLPRIYHRYDTAVSHKVSASDKQKGELRRLLDIAGSQLDQLYSFAKAAPDLYKIDKVDGRLLPLLAQWIGWKSDYRNEFDTQRNEIREAPFIYQTIGLIPNVEAAIKRLTGWECRTKEFMHNVFLSNNPERLNIWATAKNEAGKWAEPAVPLSLDYAYEGRPCRVTDEEGNAWLFYHAYSERFAGESNRNSVVCNIRYKIHGQKGWSSSRRLTDSIGIDKYPATTLHGNSLWVFWSVYDEDTAAWRLEFKVRNGGAWTPVQTPLSPDYELAFGNGSIERKRPLAVADNGGGLWLFWLEKSENSGRKWQMKYNRHDGNNWQLSPPADFPQADEVLEDPFLLFNGGANSIYLFWAKRDVQGKSEISFQRKHSIDPKLSDWDAAPRTLLKDEDTSEEPYDDREPAAVVMDDVMELFWSSNRGGSWSVWHSKMTPATEKWGTAEQVTPGPYSQRDPLPITLNGSTTLIYRSNQSITYESQVYTATETTDFRYAGSTVTDADNLAKLELRGQFDDFQSYSYDTGKEDGDWYARDTVGMYLTAGTGDLSLISRNRGIIKQLLKEIIPIQVRPVFVIETVENEKVYTYDFPKDIDKRVITEQTCYGITISGRENYKGIRGAWEDRIPEWICLHSCDCVTKMYLDEHAVNFSVLPGTSIETKYRTWHTGLNRIIEEE